VRGDGEPEDLGDLEVHDQFELGGLLHGQVGRLGALKELVHVGDRAPEEVRQTRPIGHQPAGHDRFPGGKHARQVLLGGERRDALAAHPGERIIQREERIRGFCCKFHKIEQPLSDSEEPPSMPTRATLRSWVRRQALPGPLGYSLVRGKGEPCFTVSIKNRFLQNFAKPWRGG
jgi:hypothetical protein